MKMTKSRYELKILNILNIHSLELITLHSVQQWSLLQLLKCTNTTDTVNPVQGNSIILTCANVGTVFNNHYRYLHKLEIKTDNKASGW